MADKTRGMIIDDSAPTGMPKKSIKQGAADLVLPLDHLPATIVSSDRGL